MRHDPHSGPGDPAGTGPLPPRGAGTTAGRRHVVRGMDGTGRPGPPDGQRRGTGPGPQGVPRGHPGGDPGLRPRGPLPPAVRHRPVVGVPAQLRGADGHRRGRRAGPPAGHGGAVDRPYRDGPVLRGAHARGADPAPLGPDR
ncbi:hypothetical protein SGPA1_11052 [Streptomyces misionensis JCM 4497]